MIICNSLFPVDSESSRKGGLKLGPFMTKVPLRDGFGSTRIVPWDDMFHNGTRNSKNVKRPHTVRVYYALGIQTFRREKSAGPKRTAIGAPVKSSSGQQSRYRYPPHHLRMLADYDNWWAYALVDRPPIAVSLSPAPFFVANPPHPSVQGPLISLHPVSPLRSQ